MTFLGEGLPISFSYVVSSLLYDLTIPSKVLLTLSILFRMTFSFIRLKLPFWTAKYSRRWTNPKLNYVVWARIKKYWKIRVSPLNQLQRLLKSVLIFFYQVWNDQGHTAIGSLFAVDENVGHSSIFLKELERLFKKLCDVELHMVFNFKVKILRNLFFR